MKKLQEIIAVTRREKNGLLLFVLLMLMIWMLPLWFGSHQIPSDITFQEIKFAEDSNQSKHHPFESKQPFDSYRKKNDLGIENKYYILKNFDPNTISINEWMEMGVNERTAQTISNYLSKGGSFRQAEDLKKIWGLSPALAERLMPYVQIDHTESQEKTFDRFKAPKNNTISYKRVAINLADSADWEALPGIGPVLASRIVKYRNRLGGFYDIAQLKEVYGVNDSLYMELETKLETDNHIVQFDLNTVTQPVLQQHPYFGKKLSAIIINYRKQHGTFKSLEEIQNIEALDEISYKKIIHYLKVETD